MTPEQQSQAGRLSAVYFLRPCVRRDPEARMQTQAHPRTLLDTSTGPARSVNHPALFKMNGSYLAFHYSHRFLSRHNTKLNLSVALFLPDTGQHQCIIYSLSHIVFFFFIQSLFCWSFIYKRVLLWDSCLENVDQSCECVQRSVCLRAN